MNTNTDESNQNSQGKQLKAKLMQSGKRLYDARFCNSWILNDPQRVRVWWWSPYHDKMKHKDFAVTEVHPVAFIAREGGMPWWCVSKFELMS